MYIPKHFQPSDKAAQEFLSQIESGHLVSNTEKGLVSTLLPLIYDQETNSLLGHVAKLNIQASLPTNQEALVISMLNETYISPNWYASKEEHHKVVPTWDYMMVHAYGQLVIHDEPEWILNQVTPLTNHFEASQPKPWNVDQAPTDYVDGQIRAIVGIELKINRIEASFKMSQNKSKADLDGVIAGLQKAGKVSISEAINALRPEERK
ncbi:PaiB Transcriptional regulator [actinobacterium SCGC AAA044-D11]